MGFTTKKSLIARIRDGSHIGWEDFHRAYAPFIRAVGKAEWHFNASELERLVSDVICSVFNNGILAYDPSKGGFRVWLRQIIKRRAYDMRQEEKNLSILPAEDQLRAIEDADIESREPEFDAAWNEAWRRHILKETLAELRLELEHKAWMAFEMLALKGRAAHEVAATLGMSENSIYVCKHRALAMLKRRAKELAEL